MTLDILFITPDAPTAEAINRSYPPIHDSRAVVARPLSSHGGMRAKKVVVLPLPDHWTDIEKMWAEDAIRDDAQCRVAPGGEMIRL